MDIPNSEKITEIITLNIEEFGAFINTNKIPLVELISNIISSGYDATTVSGNCALLIISLTSEICAETRSICEAVCVDCVAFLSCSIEALVCFT